MSLKRAGSLPGWPRPGKGSPAGKGARSPTRLCSRCAAERVISKQVFLKCPIAALITCDAGPDSDFPASEQAAAASFPAKAEDTRGGGLSPFAVRERRGSPAASGLGRLRALPVT